LDADFNVSGATEDDVDICPYATFSEVEQLQAIDVINDVFKKFFIPATFLRFLMFLKNFVKVFI